VAEVFVITDSSGNAQWAYAADLGGNVYRISGVSPTTPIGDTDPADWTITKIASLGCDTVATSCTTSTRTNRKFMYVPDVVEKDGTYYLMLGSGDREKPLGKATSTTAAYWPKSYATQNYFFMIKDRPTATGPTWLSTESGNCGAEVICLASLTQITTDTPSSADLAGTKGWYLVLNTNYASGPTTPAATNHYGEQVVTSAITVFGTVTFSTQTPHVPTTGECTSDLGTARVYNINYENAAPTVGTDRSQIIRGGGLPPSPVAGRVTLDDGKTYPFIIGADPSSPLEGKLPTGSTPILQPRGFQYWHIKK
jgi:type IV pilus assembly protein PilY1